MKSVKKLLSENKDKVLPGDDVKERIKRELGIDETAPSLAYAHGGEKSVSRGKRNALIAAAAAVLAVIVALSVILPVALSRTGAPLPPGPGYNKFGDITSADSFYAYGAASIGTILSAADNTEVSGRVATSAARDRDDDDDDDDDGYRPGEGSFGDIENVTATVNRYMSLVESLLGEGSITGKMGAGEEGYEHSMIVSYTDLLGGTVTYTMYYDKTLVSSETDDDEVEEDYSLEGVLVIGDARYPVEGSYETETEEDETGSEMSFVAYTSEDRRSYIAVEQELETETEDGETETEKEFVYSVYENGRRVERTTVEYESEEDELELVMTIEADGRKETLVFEDETDDGKRVLRVSGDLDGVPVSFRIYIESGEYRYVFDNGEEQDWERDR